MSPRSGCGWTMCTDGEEGGCLGGNEWKPSSDGPFPIQSRERSSWAESEAGARRQGFRGVETVVKPTHLLLPLVPTFLL